MTPLRFRHLAGVVIAAAILIVALAGWSQLRLRAMREEIDTLASETLQLDTLNRELRDRIDSASAGRMELRSSGRIVALDPVRPDDTSVAVVYYDSARNRALLVIADLASVSSPAVTHRLLIESDGGNVLSIPLEAAASREDGLLLTDLPAGVRRFVIASSSGGGWQAVLSGSTATSR